ncbi:unnamed protein product [Caenorhabditis angaria]|uniref:Uncharacterized protein n=1 Tax=Caenorhabditis angaria TaxID=860376 RepID=A0A9P1IUA6_9PELO|nr:unnamed protein product [Caenorhabditis angaria]
MAANWRAKRCERVKTSTAAENQWRKTSAPSFSSRFFLSVVVSRRRECDGESDCKRKEQKKKCAAGCFGALINSPRSFSLKFSFYFDDISRRRLLDSS